MARLKASILVGLALVLVLPTASTAAQKCQGRRATIVGTPGADNLEGTEGRDVVALLGGNDVIFTLGGNDIVCTGAGNDEAYGGAGADILLGQGGGDTLVGDVDDDRVVGGGGADYFNGGPGNDVLSGGKSDFDYADFRTSEQAVAVDLATETASGDGSDSIKSIEMIAGSEHNDTLAGTDGNLELFMPLGGDDQIEGRDGIDQLLYYESVGPISADLGAGSASGDGNDSFSSIESVVGTAAGDTMLGDERANDFYGLDGDDNIDGRDGNDYILGFAGNDQLAGGEGRYDMIDFESEAPAVTIDAAAGTSTGEGSDTISGFEIIGGSVNDDTLIGGDGNELFYAYSGDDSIDGGGGNDAMIYNVSPAPVIVDLGQGTASGEGTDTFTAIEGVVGSRQDDSITGDAAQNFLIGNAGDDELSGADGNDYFEGGPGNDSIDGGPGQDFVNFFRSGAAVTADLAGTATGQGSDTLSGLESILGSDFDDILRGDDGPNFLRGGEGDDDLSGRGGDDTLQGGPGTNVVDGGPGTDTCFGGATLTACESEQQAEPSEEEVVELAEQMAAILDELNERRHI